jgi:hypothetical protein
MIIGHLYTFAKYPTAIPLYKMGFTRSFLFGWRVEAGFDKHVMNLSRNSTYYGIDYQDRTTNGMSNRVPCLPLESRIED